MELIRSLVELWHGDGRAGLITTMIGFGAGLVGAIGVTCVVWDMMRRGQQRRR